MTSLHHAWASWVAVVSMGVGMAIAPDWQITVISILICWHVVSVLIWLSAPEIKPKQSESQAGQNDQPDGYWVDPALNDDWWKNGDPPPWDKE